MFEWLKRAFSHRQDDERRRFFELVDALNARASGGTPTTVERRLGTLRIHSGVLAIGDPQDMPSVEIPDIDAAEVSISARLWRYPSGSANVVGLAMSIGDDSQCDVSCKVGELAIDSAKVIVADRADIREYWTETGLDRIGVISTARDKTVLRELTRRFKLKTTQVNVVRAEVVGAVSKSLEQEIEDYLRSIPEYARYPFMQFYVQTNNSFDRANFMNKAWEFMPVGNAEFPVMFVCGTGRGDGRYDVRCRYCGNRPRVVTIDFIGDEGEGARGEYAI